MVTAQNGQRNLHLASLYNGREVQPCSGSLSASPKHGTLRAHVSSRGSPTTRFFSRRNNGEGSFRLAYWPIMPYCSRKVKSAGEGRAKPFWRLYTEICWRKPDIARVRKCPLRCDDEIKFEAPTVHIRDNPVEYQIIQIRTYSNGQTNQDLHSRVPTQPSPTNISSVHDSCPCPYPKKKNPFNFTTSNPQPATMLPSFAILAVFLPLALSVPSPHGGSGGGHDRRGILADIARAAATVAAAVAANARNDAFNWPAPDGGDHASGSCTFSSDNIPPSTIAAADQIAWQAEMGTCLNGLNATNWHGTACYPPGGPTMGFTKGTNDYSDGVDCFNRCQGCLSSAIVANQSVVTKCQYEYRTNRALVGFKTHTCTMGYHPPDQK